ncbi:MAG TPA: hypothetical protein VF268_08330 [Gammaproteobacteria bacterium]
MKIITSIVLVGIVSMAASFLALAGQPVNLEWDEMNLKHEDVRVFLKKDKESGVLKHLKIQSGKIKFNIDKRILSVVVNPITSRVELVSFPLNNIGSEWEYRLMIPYLGKKHEWVECDESRLRPKYWLVIKFNDNGWHEIEASRDECGE